jgi:hypothetical protein
MALTWPQGRKRIHINLGGPFATFEVNVDAIKHCCVDEIHIIESKETLNQSLYLLLFHFISFHLLFFLLNICAHVPIGMHDLMCESTLPNDGTTILHKE